LDYYKFLQENVYNLKTNTSGRAWHLIVMVEQLFKAKEGHYLWMGQLIHRSAFQKLLAQINVDEAHFIHTAGIKQHGVNPFRPAWGTVDELQALLASSIPWHLFSATWPPHICKTVESKILCSNYVSIEISSNRPNTKVHLLN